MSLKIMLEIKNRYDIEVAINDARFYPNPYYPQQKQIFDDFVNRIIDFAEKESAELKRLHYQIDKLRTIDRQNAEKESAELYIQQMQLNIDRQNAEKEAKSESDIVTS